MNEAITTIFALSLSLAACWFNFVILNTVVTFFKCRNKDNDLKFIFNPKGKLVYGGFTILYFASLISGIVLIFMGLSKGDRNLWLNIGLPLITIISFLYSFLIAQTIMVGRKFMMVGRMQIDYRKLKKVNYSYNGKMSFVYAQNDYHFSTHWIDLTTLRKKISK